MFEFRLFSDLHTEFASFIIPKLPGDEDRVLILAGDCAVGKRTATIQELAVQFPRFRAVVWVMGNHEYYGGSLIRTRDKIEEIVNSVVGEYADRVHIWEQGAHRFGDVTVVGASMWTDFDKESPHVMQMAGQYMNDYRVIRTGPATDPYERKLRPMDILARHHDDRSFFIKTIRAEKESGQRVLGVTHHGTSWQSVAENFSGSPINGCYVTEFGYELLEMSDDGVAPDMLVHGHIHNSFDYTIGDTRIVTNPRGYVTNDTPTGENSRDFNPELVLQL